jgi:hypothetical protein
LGEFSDFEHGYGQTSLLCAARHRELGRKPKDIKIDATFGMICWRFMLVKEPVPPLRNNYSVITNSSLQHTSQMPMNKPDIAFNRFDPANLTPEQRERYARYKQAAP